MKKYIITLIAFTLVLYSCNSIEKKQEYDEDGILFLEYYEDSKTGLKEGEYKVFYSDGTPSEISSYKGGVLVGTRILYNEKGGVQTQETYNASGTIDGEFKTFYLDGTLLQEGKYINGEMEGVWKTYYPSGTLKEEVTFLKNNENGPFVEYSEKGVILAKGAYKDGDFEHGPLELFDEEGVMYRKMNCDKGICSTTWLKEGYEDYQLN